MKATKETCRGSGDEAKSLAAAPSSVSKPGATPILRVVCRVCGKAVAVRPNMRLKEHLVGTRPQRLAAEELYRRRAVQS